MKKAVRLADIAERLQVSTVTVSNALAGQKGVSEELRAQIRQTAKEMGYQPREAGSGASVPRKIYNVGVIISEKYLGDYPSYYWKIYQELSLKAVDYHCTLSFEVLRHEAEDEKKLPLFAQEKQVQGLMVLGELGSEYLRFLYEESGLPLVFLDFVKREIPVPAVMANNYYGMYKMVNYLLDRGHTRIAYVGTILSSNSITDRYYGYCKALLERGIALNSDWVLDDRTMEGQIGNIRLPDPMPTAFACNCDVTASEVINTLERSGYRIPEDVSVVGFDNYLYEGLCDVRVTSYEVNLRDMVKQALKVFLAQVENSRTVADMQLISGKVVEKDSVRERSAAWK
ncbi:MAG: LacI family DNA-binding transcriptional regulator [Eubacteriales bacterium]|nr:LacI family DNA-binding transcriptional regulator [Eubacteriales bacterium]